MKTDLAISTLFLPMLAMFLWTLAMFVRNAVLRIRAIRSRHVSMRFFEVFKGAEMPENLQKASNNLNNLMQLPQLFYVICLYISFSSLTDPVFTAIAWLYVALRAAHGIVHVTYNKVPHRFAFFIGSNIALAVLWIRTAVFVLS